MMKFLIGLIIIAIGIWSFIFGIKLKITIHSDWVSKFRFIGIGFLLMILGIVLLIMDAQPLSQGS